MFLWTGPINVVCIKSKIFFFLEIRSNELLGFQFLWCIHWSSGSKCWIVVRQWSSVNKQTQLFSNFQWENTAAMTEQVREQHLTRQQLSGEFLKQESEAEKGHGAKKQPDQRDEREEKQRGALSRVVVGPWLGLTSLMAVQNSLWRTFFRDWSLWPGTSPDSCSFSSSSMALATSGRKREREKLRFRGVMPRGRREKKIPRSITLTATATRKVLKRINGRDNGNGLSQGQLGQER